MEYNPLPPIIPISACDKFLPLPVTINSER
jgi:hypothetical protein